MSGILDSKSRVIDSIITLEGRKQLSQGGLNIKFVSFTDGSTFYELDSETGNSDATKRIYFESSNLPHDSITFQSNKNGDLSFRSDETSDVFVKNGKILQPVSSSNILEPLVTYSAISGNEFHLYADKILKSSIDNFTKNRLLTTKDSLFEDDEFLINTNEISFTMKKNSFVLSEKFEKLSLNEIPNIFEDVRFSNKENFLYLPPVNKIESDAVDKRNFKELTPFLLGEYGDSLPPKNLKPNQVLLELSEYFKSGYGKKISFDPTSRKNNIFFQFFEESNENISKLDIIDFGEYNLSDREHEDIIRSFGESNQIGKNIHLFFVGKLFVAPETQTSTFVQLFTMVFG